MIYVYRLDDPTDAVAIHLIPGFWGAIAVPLFSFTGQLLSTHQNRLYCINVVSVYLLPGLGTLPLFSFVVL
jgi:ammonia channel protein AmtB